MRLRDLKYEVYQKDKVKNVHPTSFLQPLPVYTTNMDDVFMGFVDDLPLSKDYSVIMVVMDSLSKYIHFMTLKNPFTTLEVASLFLDVWLSTYMACSRVLFRMEVLLLQVYLGGNYSSCRVLVSFTLLHFTLKMMVKVKLSLLLLCILPSKWWSK